MILDAATKAVSVHSEQLSSQVLSYLLSWHDQSSRTFFCEVVLIGWWVVRVPYPACLFKVEECSSVTTEERKAEQGALLLFFYVFSVT